MIADSARTQSVTGWPIAEKWALGAPKQSADEFPGKLYQDSLEQTHS